MLRLHIKDIDFAMQQFTIRSGMEDQDRGTTLAWHWLSLCIELWTVVKCVQEEDLSEGFNAVKLSSALAKKYATAATEWGWQYVFPAPHRSIDPRPGIKWCRHPVETVLQKVFKKLSELRVLSNLRAAIPGDTLLQRFFLKTAILFEPFKGYSAMARFVLPWSIPLWGQKTGWV